MNCQLEDLTKRRRNRQKASGDGVYEKLLNIAIDRQKTCRVMSCEFCHTWVQELEGFEYNSFSLATSNKSPGSIQH